MSQIDSSGYVYARVWRGYQGKDDYDPNDIYYSIVENTKKYGLNDLFQRDRECHVVSIGQTSRSLEQRYLGEKSINPIKEWRGIVNNPKVHEDKLRKSFKNFLSDKLYQIMCFEEWLEDYHLLLAEKDGEEIVGIKIFAAQKQISTDMFIIPGITFRKFPLLTRRMILQQEVLIFTFFNGYFDALNNVAISSIEQGILI